MPLLCSDGNNCGCNEHQNVPSWGPPVSPGQHDGIHHYEGEIQATIDFGFDGIKLDGCGEFKNLTVFAELMNKTGKPILVEDCHWGHDGPGDWGDGGHLNQGPNQVPADKWCPFNVSAALIKHVRVLLQPFPLTRRLLAQFFRTSGDIGASWGRVIGNLQSVIKHQPWDNQSAVRTGPGCFAYPDSELFAQARSRSTGRPGVTRLLLVALVALPSPRSQQCSRWDSSPRMRKTGVM